MASPYNPILSSAGLVTPSGITADKKSGLITDVIESLKQGSQEGDPRFRFPPVANTADIEGVLRDESKSKPFQSVFVGSLFETVAKTLDIPGATPIPLKLALPTPVYNIPFFDVSSVFPDISAQIPTTAAGLAQWVLDLIGSFGGDPINLFNKLMEAKITPLLEPDVPPIPELPIPPIVVPQNLPGLSELVPLGVFDRNELVLPGFLSDMLKIPFDLLKQFFIPNPADLIKLLFDLADPTKLLQNIKKMALDMVAKIPQIAKFVEAPTTQPPAMLFSIVTTLIDKIVGMVGSVLTGMTIGAGGASKTVMQLIGLV